MNHTLLKDTLRLIFNHKGRYLSFVFIVLIGTAFYTGVTASSTMMAQNVDTYNDENHLKDITIYSNYGFDQDDLDAIAALPDVEAVQGSKFADVIASDGQRTSITRVHCYHPEAKVNAFVLAEGRLPENEHEVLGEKGSELTPGFPLGSKLTLSRPDDDLSDWLTIDEVTIVGTIDTPLYLNETKENSTLGNQYLHTYLYAMDSIFQGDYDTEVNLITTKGSSYNSFYKPYMDYMDMVVKEIEQLAKTQAPLRMDTIKQEASNAYNDGLKEYQEGLQTYEDKIADAKLQLDNAASQIESQRNQLEKAQLEINNGKSRLILERDQAQSQIDDGYQQYKQGYQTYMDGKAAFELTKQDLYNKQTQIDEGIQQIDEAIPQLQQAKDGYDQVTDAINKLDETIPLLQQGTVILNSFLQLVPDAGNIQLMDIETTIDTYFNDYLTSLQLTKENTFHDYFETILKENPDLLDDYHTVIAQYGTYTVSQLLQQYPDLAKLFDQIPINPEETMNQLLDTTIQQALQPLIDLQQLQTQLDIDETTTLQQLNEQLPDKITQLTDTKQQLIETRFAIIDGLNKQNLTVDQIDDQILSLQQQKDTLQNARKQIEEGLQQGEDELSNGLQQLQSSLQQLTDAQKTLDEKIAQGENTLQQSQAQLYQYIQLLSQAEQQLMEGYETFTREKEDGYQQLQEAKAKLDKAKADIASLEQCEWTILDRSKHYASETFKNTVHQMKSIADIFPVFFLLVASLVCLTTMTRMVDEERGQIGIMRALGYTQLQCAFRYLVYAGSATLIGCLFGAVVGMLTFPMIIYNAWKMMYILPPMHIYINYGVIVQAVIAFMSVSMLTTWFTCYKDMKEVPSQLLRPKAPKLGKATVLEKIPLIWSRLSFTWKVTIRNLLRYKKRLVMTVIGVAGCTALLITGYGVKDSIQSMVDLQFKEILHYQGGAVFEDETGIYERQKSSRQIASRSDVERVELVGEYSTLIKSAKQDETANLIVFDDAQQVEDLFTLRTRKNHQPLQLTDDGVIISEKLSENLNLKTGDTIRLESQAGLQKDCVITGIAEMYIQHYVFMSKTYYKNVFGTEMTQNRLLIQEKEGVDTTRLQNDLLQYDEIASVDFVDGVLDNFNAMVKSLDFIVWVLIISSMSLAFVVLGNLTNINISERQREIATLKVLGFRKKEVESYIYKENNILTFFGALCGIPVGNYLHHYIMRQVEMDYVMFGRRVMMQSFVISVVLTIGFGLLVNFFMRKKLHLIEMVESLKSVE